MCSSLAKKASEIHQQEGLHHGCCMEDYKVENFMDIKVTEKSTNFAYLENYRLYGTTFTCTYTHFILNIHLIVL